MFALFKKELKTGKVFGILILCISILIMAGGCASPPAVNDSIGNPPIPRGPLYTGDGGKNTKIAVLQPQAEGLPQEQQWISTYIQGVLTSDFNKYTAMTVIDRQNLDKLIDNQDFSASGYFSDFEAEIRTV